jgi:hypothetical protein
VAFEFGHPENWQDATELFAPDVPPTEMILETRLRSAEYRELEAYARRHGMRVVDAVRRAIAREIGADWFHAPETRATSSAQNGLGPAPRSQASSKRFEPVHTGS